MPVPFCKVLFRDKTSKAPVEQFLALNPQKSCSGEIHLFDNSPAGKGKVADRREVVEISIPVSGFLQIKPGLSERLVLHLKLDLVHFEFVYNLLMSLPFPLMLCTESPGESLLPVSVGLPSFASLSFSSRKPL